MKKLFLLLSILAASVPGSYAQKGDLYAGAVGGYITNYKGAMYGLNVSYHLSDPLEVSFTGLMNPKITGEADTPDETKIKMYSANLDFRFYMVLQRDWATGPCLGVQYSYLDKNYIKYPINNQYYLNVEGANFGWHLRGNLTEHLKLNGGWRYTTANRSASHHLFYIGLGYAFNTY
jgi:opacity protein-like surface antigen